LPAESRTKTVPSIFALGVLAWLPRVPGTKQQVTNRKKMIFTSTSIKHSQFHCGDYADSGESGFLSVFWQVRRSTNGIGVAVNL